MLRGIRSYVKRQGRESSSQQRALKELWPLFGIDYAEQLLELNHIFQREAPRTLEIGFGNGANLLTQASAHPESDFIGIDVYRAGAGTLLLGIEANQLTNLRVISHDAVLVLQHMIPDASLEKILILFPDPWHKKRHHKRRLISPSFIALLHQKLKPGGHVHLATDWEDYALQMMELFSAAPGFTNQAGPGNYHQNPERITTKFETRGRNLGHGVWDLLFTKIE
jgi:tRNA (guanine-N7-)-methyltransferase